MFEDAIVSLARDRPRTAQHAFETGRRILRDARDRGQTVDEAVFRLSPPKYDERKPVFLAVDELRHLASRSSEPHLIEFAGLSGLRMGEIAALRDSDLDLDARVLVVQRAGYRDTGWDRTKTEQSVRRVYLPEHATELLREQLGAREAGPWVFPDEEGRQWSKRALYRRFEKAARRSGRPDMHFHDLRHTFVSLMAKPHAVPAEIARHLGHVDGGVLVSRRYQHLFPDALEGAQHRLDQLIADTDAGSVRDRVVSKAQKPRKQAVRRDGRTWDRTRQERSQQSATEGDSSPDLQGDDGGDEPPLDRPDTTTHDPAIGQGVHKERCPHCGELLGRRLVEIDDDPRSQRGPSSGTGQTDPGGAGVGPPG